VKRLQSLDARRGTFLGVFAGLVVHPEVWITGLLCDDGRVDDGRWRDESRLARVDASGELALSDEGPGTLVGDNLEVVRATDVCDVDGRRRPYSEDDGPLLLSHGDVLGVVVPVIAEVVELALEFMGDGEYGGIVCRWEVYGGTEESASLGVEEIEDFAPDKGSDGGSVGHGVVIRQRGECL